MHLFFSARAGEYLHERFRYIEVMMAALTGDSCPCCGTRHAPESMEGGFAAVRAQLEDRVRQMRNERVCEQLETLSRQGNAAIVDAGFTDRVEVITLWKRACVIAAWRVTEHVADTVH